MEYIFRVLIDSEEEEGGVFRDIAVNATSSFSQLHDGIMKAFEFRGDQMASFYLSDEEWTKGDEIGLMDMSGDGSNFKLMGETNLNELIQDTGQKLIYVYDFLNMWCFFVELVEINDIDDKKEYPTIIRSLGVAPSEDSKDIMGDIDFSEDFDEEGDDDDYGFNDFDDSFEFENIDDIDL